MILFSIIIPVFRVPLDYLRICLNSLAEQSFHECEFIVISDGAPEAECSICNEYAIKDARFKFFNREHAGVSAARNYGIEQAQGEYITFLDSDDYILSNSALETIKKFIEKQPDILLLNWIDHSNVSSRNPFKESNLILTTKQKEQCISNIIFSKGFGVTGGIVAKVFKRNYINQHKIRFNTNFSIGEDRVFNYDVFSHSCIVAYQDYVFYYYRFFPQSLSQKRNSYFPPRFLPYIKELKIHSSNQYPILIAKETVSMLYKSWKFYYNTPEYSKFKSKRILDFIHLIMSKDIRHLGNLNIKTIFSLGLDYLKYKAKSISSIFSKE